MVPKFLLVHGTNLWVFCLLRGPRDKTTNQRLILRLNYGTVGRALVERQGRAGGRKEFIIYGGWMGDFGCVYEWTVSGVFVDDDIRKSIDVRLCKPRAERFALYKYMYWWNGKWSWGVLGGISLTTYYIVVGEVFTRPIIRWDLSILYVSQGKIIRMEWQGPKDNIKGTSKEHYANCNGKMNILTAYCNLNCEWT